LRLCDQRESRQRCAERQTNDGRPAERRQKLVLHSIASFAKERYFTVLIPKDNPKIHYARRVNVLVLGCDAGLRPPSA
jgi:hypothetical protein